MWGKGGRTGSGARGEGWPGLFWSQTDMFRFEMSRAGSVTERERDTERERKRGGRGRWKQSRTGGGLQRVDERDISVYGSL